METPIKQWMSGDPVSIDADASALAALELLLDHGIRHLPVVDAARRVVGVLSIDDLRAALPFPVELSAPPSPADRELAQQWCVGEIMTHAPVTLGEDAALAEAAALMAERRIGCVPVVEPNGALAGILSETDALHALATSLWSDEVREQRARRSEREAFVEELARERDRIRERIEEYEEAEGALSAEGHAQPTDQAEAAADLEGVRRSESLAALAERRLHAIERALDRAAAGQLGRCERCGAAIPLTRLRALPDATRCVACARKGENAAPR